MRWILCLLVSALMLLRFFSPAYAQGPAFDVLDLGARYYYQDYAYTLNRVGAITGEARSGAWVYVEGKRTILPRAVGFGINDSNQVTGFYVLADRRAHAFLHSNGILKDLGTLGGMNSFGNAINNQGQIVGDAFTSTNESHAFLWDSTGMKDLGLFGGESSSAIAINDNGDVVVQSVFRQDNRIHTFRYRAGQATEIWTPGAEGWGINAIGQIVGGMWVGGNIHAFIWSSTEQILDIGTLGGSDSIARGINSSGQVVGSSVTNQNEWHAFIYSEGVMTDLNSLIETNQKLVIDDCVAINDEGRIVALGRLNGSEHLFMLVPKRTWGVPVMIKRNSGRQYYDILIAMSKETVYTRSDIVIEAERAILVTTLGTPISEIDTIELIPDSILRANAGMSRGFNKFCSSDSGSALELAEKSSTSGRTIPCYRAGIGWSVIDTANGDLQSGQLSDIYAIPRCPAPNGWVPPSKRTPADDQVLKETITSAAASFSIPPMVLFGVLWVESKGISPVGWNQWGFMSVRLHPGVPGNSRRPYVKDPPGSARTLVTYDGGIGIGQITSATALETVPEEGNATPQDILTHIYRLANDVDYNIEVSARLLEKKRQLVVETRKTPIGDTSNVAGRTVIENWYNAIWGYNSFPNGRKASSSAAPVYPDKVEKAISEGGKNRWKFWKSVPLGEYKVFTRKIAVKKNGVIQLVDAFRDAAQPTLGNNLSTKAKAAHIDVDFDGQVDAVLHDPRFVNGDAGDQIMIIVETDPSRPTVMVSTMDAKITGGALPSEVVIPLNRGSDGAYVGTWAGRHFAASMESYRIEFSVVMTNAGAGGNSATGITYDFTVD